MYDVLSFGAKNDIAFNSAPAFQAAVDACKDAGGVVYVPFGEYMLSSVHLYSNVHIVFEPGVRLYGSLNPDDFDEREKIDYKLYQDASHSYFHRSLFWAENCENISFKGNATIDMREVWENEPLLSEIEWTQKRAVKIFAFKQCKNIMLTDMTLLHSTDVAVYMAGCDGAKLSHLTLDVNIDGISPDCCTNVVISDCIIRSGDDAIVLKSSYALNKKLPCENITVTNCTVTSRANAIKIGTETNGDFRNIVISNCTVYNTYYAGIAVETTDGSNIDGVIISNIAMTNVGNPIFVILSDRARGPKPCSIGSMRNVIISNITASGPYTTWPAPQLSHLAKKNDICMSEISPCTVTGQPYKKIESISISDVYITVPGGGTEEDKNTVLKEITKEYPENRFFGDRFPVYGMYFRHISNLKLRNINIDTINPDARPALAFDDVDNRIEL